MYAMEKGETFLRKVAKYWNIPLTSFSYHMNAIIKSKKVGPQGMIIE
jgi:hypothetical protein